MFTVAHQSDDGHERCEAHGDKLDSAKELARILADFLRKTKAGMTIDKATNKPVEYPDQLGHR